MSSGGALAPKISGWVIVWFRRSLSARARLHLLCGFLLAGLVFSNCYLIRVVIEGEKSIAETAMETIHSLVALEALEAEKATATVESVAQHSYSLASSAVEVNQSMSKAAEKVLNSAATLSMQSEATRSHVEDFLNGIREA